MNLKGKCLNLTSTFNPTSPAVGTLWALRMWWLNMPQPTCLETMNSLSISWVVNIINVHLRCCNNNISIFVIIYCISQYIVSTLWYNTFVCILYIWQWFSYWESSCLYIDFYGSQSDEKWYVPCGHMHHKLYTQGSPMFPLSLRERRYFKIARRDEVFVGSTRVIFTIPVGTRVTSGCFIASQV